MTKRKLKGKTHFYLLKRKMYFDFHFISLFFIPEQFRLKNKRRIIFLKKERKFFLCFTPSFSIYSHNGFVTLFHKIVFYGSMNAKSKFYLATA